jgi:pyruvate/2-oxoglutarate dehydrogenase complex dihydrolipoamide dehydrogenase (E3) component
LDTRVERFDVFVIGGGGTGSEVAFRLSARGDLRVGLAERHLLGGECNHYGCVPTKVMLRSAEVAHLARNADRFGVGVLGPVEVDLEAVRERVRRVIEDQSGEGAAPFERLGVRVFELEARLVGPNRIELADGTQLEAGRIVLATGTQASAPPIDGLAAGPYWTNREAIWDPPRVPGSLLVVGTGAIGIEFSQIYARFGARVTALEVLPHVLPNEDEEAAASLVPALEREGIALRPGVTIESARHDGAGWTVTLEGGERLVAERLLVAAGRRPVFGGHDLAAAGIEVDDGGRPILTETLRTTNPGVWVAGDATGELLFTHVGTYEAGLVVDDIAGLPRPRDYRVVPRVTFCDPEVASVGLTEAQARAAGHEVITGVARFADNERAHIDDAVDGLVKIVADARDGLVLGGHIVGDEAGAMIHEVVVAMAGAVSAPTIADTIHAYPTLSESVREAFRAVRG